MCEGWIEKSYLPSDVMGLAYLFFYSPLQMPPDFYLYCLLSRIYLGLALYGISLLDFVILVQGIFCPSLRALLYLETTSSYEKQ